MTVAAMPREEFLAALRPPPGHGSVPSFDSGWLGDQGSQEPFLAYRSAIDVNWSPELEALHEESSRDHFLDVSTRRALVDGIREAVGANSTIADLGCSTGYLLRDLQVAYPDAFLVGVDLVEQGLRRAYDQVPDAALLLADMSELPFGDASLSAIVSANALEHIPDDDAVLAEILRVLAPGGRAAVVVPAGPGLYDYYDAFLSHERRYRRRELATKARRTGFEVVREAFLGSLIYPAFWLVKKTNRVRYRNVSRAQIETLVRRDIDRTEGSRIGTLAAGLEERLLRRSITLPFGIRRLTVLKKVADR
jgi:ubiquinone/menaquinone biosynthesis C-methylase UbiE